MKKNFVAAGVSLLFSFSVHAQLTYVGDKALVTVTANTLVYNGGGMKMVGTSQINNFGNIMVVGASADKFETDNSTNFVLKSIDASNYGQLYISGLIQTGITGNISKEFQTPNNGSYQQIGMPFYQKVLNTLNQNLGKTFSNTRYSLNEILTWDNAKVFSRNFDITTATTDPTAYYMLGNLNGLVDFSTVHSLTGRPYAEETVPARVLSGAGAGIDFKGGSAKNIYNERYDSYLQDNFDISTPYTGNFGKNIYQYSNPYFTNLDLSNIYLNDINGDGNYITNIQGIRLDPGIVVTDASGTYGTTPSLVTFTGGVAVGDLNRLIIKPLQTFVIKLNSTASSTLNFANLRRFGNKARTDQNYSVTAAKNAGSTNRVKQLGVIALNNAGEEMGRTYFVVYNNGVSGHTDGVSTEAQSNSNNVIGTFEENANGGGIDNNYSSKYWLYINEANEQDFQGKAIPLELYNEGIKSLKFEIRENQELLTPGNSNLSTGIGFYYKADNGSIEEVRQGQSIPVTTDSYSLYYGAPNNGTLETNSTSLKPSRTQVAYNPGIDNYVIRFDADWKKADIKVYDISGKLILSQRNVSTASDYVISLSKDNRTYIVTATSEKGVRAIAKIIR